MSHQVHFPASPKGERKPSSANFTDIFGPVPSLRCDSDSEAIALVGHRKHPDVLRTNDSQMETADSDHDSAEIILRVLSIACSDAWCFAPIDNGGVGYCSPKFARDWGLQRVEKKRARSLVFSLDDPAIAKQLNAWAVEPDWLLRATIPFHQTTDAAERASEFFVERLRRSVLTDDDGRPLGVLLVFRPTAPSHVPFDVHLQAREAQKRIDRLSPRESEILELIFDGLTNKAIAARAMISEKTVEKHRANVMRKIGVRSIAELIRRVTEARLLIPRQALDRNSLD